MKRADFMTTILAETRAADFINSAPVTVNDQT